MSKYSLKMVSTDIDRCNICDAKVECKKRERKRRYINATKKKKKPVRLMCCAACKERFSTCSIDFGECYVLKYS